MKLAILVGATLTMVGSAFAQEQVFFNRDVRPILAEHCWQCHGPDANTRQAGLRLDEREATLQPADSGTPAITPGRPSQSELIRRVSASAESERMPPPEFNKPLSAEQVETLRQWIDGGAEFEKHWSFQPIRRPAVPLVSDAANPIDSFVSARLQKHGRKLAPRAPRERLLRRVTFALTGLPPTFEELDSDESYEQAVDRLLASPHFGEHMAVA